MQFFNKGIDYLKIIVVIFISDQEVVHESLLTDLIARLGKTVKVLEQEETALLGQEKSAM
jgi:hypothetical protein